MNLHKVKLPNSLEYQIVKKGSEIEIFHENCERWVLEEQKHRRQYSTQKSPINFSAKLRAAFAYSADGELLCDDNFLVGAVIFHSTAK